MKKKKRILISAVVGLSLLTVFFSLFSKKTLSFDQFCRSIFLEEVASDTLSLHYMIADPESFGIETASISLPDYDKNNEKKLLSKAENYLAALQQYSSLQLSSEEFYTLQLLSKNISQTLEGSRFYYFNEIFSPSGGIQTQYPVLMAEYAFRSKEDIDHYLTLLSKTPAYFDSLITYETEKTARGYGMPDYSLEKVIAQCRCLIRAEELEQGNHFLQTTFRERIDQSISDRLISSKEGASYILQNTTILKEIVCPAYQKLASDLSHFYSLGKNEKGLCFYPDGKEYYAWLFSKNTGSSKDPQQAYHTLAQNYYHTIQNLIDALDTYQQETSLTQEETSYFPLTDADDILSDLTNRMTNDFPSLKNICSGAFCASVKPVNSALEDYTAPAFYLVPPIDDNKNNIIYINQKSTPDGILLYTTLAHEGYPGHLYQTTYYQCYQQKNEISPIRHILNYGGYAEGWALYTELLSYDYAADLLMEKTGNDSYSLLYDVYRTERCSQLAMLSLLDIGIHYYGFSMERTNEILTSYGVEDQDTVQNIYEYIVENPTNYPKYYCGYLEILELKETAEKKWGDSYSDYRFHLFLLQSGPSDFESLSKKLQTYLF